MAGSMRLPRSRTALDILDSAIGASEGERAHRLGAEEKNKLGRLLSLMRNLKFVNVGYNSILIPVEIVI